MRVVIEVKIYVVVDDRMVSVYLGHMTLNDILQLGKLKVDGCGLHGRKLPLGLDPMKILNILILFNLTNKHMYFEN